MYYIIRIDQGDYLVQRGGFDWGRADKHAATTYDTIDEALAAIRRCGGGLIARAIEDDDGNEYIATGTYAGMTRAQVLADRDAFNRAVEG